jgi:hypothetical protein
MNKLFLSLLTITAATFASTVDKDAVYNLTGEQNGLPQYEKISLPETYKRWSSFIPLSVIQLFGVQTTEVVKDADQAIDIAIKSLNPDFIKAGEKTFKINCPIDGNVALSKIKSTLQTEKQQRRAFVVGAFILPYISNPFVSKKSEPKANFEPEITAISQLESGHLSIEAQASLINAKTAIKAQNPKAFVQAANPANPTLVEKAKQIVTSNPTATCVTAYQAHMENEIGKKALLVAQALKKSPLTTIAKNPEQQAELDQIIADYQANQITAFPKKAYVEGKRLVGSAYENSKVFADYAFENSKKLAQTAGEAASQASASIKRLFA